MRKSVISICKCAFLVVLLWLPAVGGLAARLPSSLLGSWQLQEGGEIVLIEDSRLIISKQGELQVLGVVGYGDGLLTVRNSGLLEHWGAAINESSLTLSHAGAARRFRRLDTVPDSVTLNPVPLGVAISLPSERVLAIQQDLAERLRKDQEAMRNKALKEEEVDSLVVANSRHLRDLVQEVGWIDSARFGSKTSYAAVILAKHGDDLRLLLTVLPLIEKDFKRAGDDAQAFAIVYDAVQIDLGRKQRFGTQIRGVGAGKPFVLPLENPALVDQFRREIGLPPLAEYLSTAGKVLEMEISMPPKEEGHRSNACMQRSKSGPPKPLGEMK